MKGGSKRKASEIKREYYNTKYAAADPEDTANGPASKQLKVSAAGSSGANVSGGVVPWSNAALSHVLGLGCVGAWLSILDRSWRHFHRCVL
jgi:hypothetical protein